MTNNTPDSVSLRTYEEIFTGSNQQYGYARPYLGFDAPTALQQLNTDKTTYFHYPIAAPITPLSAAGLIEDGAIAGPIPYRADKIWKKQADYHKYVWFGDASAPQQGTWLCAWLSGSPDGLSATWMDRWYNPGTAIPSTTAGMLSAYYVNTPAIVDEPSIMTFEPGVWYRYSHIGDNYNQLFVNDLTSNNTSVSSLLLVNLDKWTYPMIDDTPYNHAVVLRNFQSNMIQKTDLNQVRTDDTSLYLSGNQYAEVLFTNDLNINDQLSVTTWAKVHNWNEVRGYEILGKSFRGGWSIRYDNGFYTPTFSIMSSSNGTLLQGSNAGDIIVSKALPGNSLPINCAIDRDLYTWIIDNGTKTLYKTDYEGTIDLQVVFNPSVNLSDITIDGNNVVWVLDTSAAYASGFDAQGNYIQRIVQTGTNLDVTSQSILSSFNCIDMCFDNTDTLYRILSSGLYQGSTSIYSDPGLYRIKCDKDNNLWVLKTPNIFIKMNTTGSILLSGVVDNMIADNACNLSLTNEYVNKIAKHQDFVWFTSPRANKIYKYDTNGNLTASFNIAAFDVPSANKDFTSYDWNRKFNYLAYNQTPQIKAEVFIGTFTAPVCGRQTIAFPVSGFNVDEWHHFALVYDNVGGNFSFIVDAINCGNIAITPGYYIYYNYENSISVGADSGKIEVLDVQLNTNSLFFNGYIDDVRVYNSVLDVFNIRNILLTKFPHHNLKWNMLSGLQNYIESIERFFKFKAPGAKSQYYNIRLSGLQIMDPDVRGMIEDIIRQTVVKISPSHAELYQIIWE